MDEPLLKSGQFPNVAILAGTDPAEVMREHGLEGYGGWVDYCMQHGDSLGEALLHADEICRAEQADTREKLEADIANWLDENLRTNPYDAGIAYGWLDRQAAITTAYCTSEDESCCEACRAAQKREIAELTAERDELNGKMEAEHSLRLHWKAQAEELTAERDQLKADLDAEHALVVQFEHDNEELRDTCNTLRASVAGLKMTVERFKARESREPADMGN